MQTMISLRRLTGQIGGLVGAEYPYPDKFIVQGVSWAFPRRTRSVLADLRETEASRMRVVYERESQLNIPGNQQYLLWFLGFCPKSRRNLDGQSM